MKTLTNADLADDPAVRRRRFLAATGQRKPYVAPTLTVYGDRHPLIDISWRTKTLAQNQRDFLTSNIHAIDGLIKSMTKSDFIAKMDLESYRDELEAKLTAFDASSTAPQT